MALPPSLRWIEVDLPDILDYKADVLASETPRCAIERVPIDLSNADARRGLFARLGRTASRTLILSEGLLIYLMADEVCALGRDLAVQPAFRSGPPTSRRPGCSRDAEGAHGRACRGGRRALCIRPPEGPAFFQRCGWTPEDVQSLLKAAHRLGRLPLAMRMFAMLPESNGAQGSRPWSAVVVLKRSP